EIDHAVRRALTEPDHANDGEQPEVGDVVRERGLAEDLEDASDWVRPESYALDSRQGQQVAADHEECEGERRRILDEVEKFNPGPVSRCAKVAEAASGAKRDGREECGQANPWKCAKAAALVGGDPAAKQHAKCRDAEPGNDRVL